MPIESRNPATGELVATFEPLDQGAVEERLGRAAGAFRAWRRTPLHDRARVLVRLAERLEAGADRLSRLMTLEMGKVPGEAEAEILKSARACRYYAEHGASFLADEEIATEAARSYVRYEPVGVILAIMPWNFPFWQVFRFAAPALMAGNVALLKHAPNVPQCALAIEALFADAECPDGVFQTLLIETDQVPGILEDARVAAVTLTGSDRAGREVAGRAGRALKKSVLELGGSDPFIVMPSADLGQAVATAVRSRTLNSGQSCIAAKRFIVARPVLERFLEPFVAAMAALKVGDPRDAGTDVGPLARGDLLDTLAAQVDDAVARGARVLTGGARLERPGHFYPPTVLVDVPRESRSYREELFGPVATVFPVDGIDEAIAIANDTPYGLTSYVQSGDPERTRKVSRRLRAGMVQANGAQRAAGSPFGGVKQSGNGREGGTHGLMEYLDVKAVSGW